MNKLYVGKFGGVYMIKNGKKVYVPKPKPCGLIKKQCNCGCSTKVLKK